MAVDVSGSLNIADIGDYRIRQIDLSGKIPAMAGSGESRDFREDLEDPSILAVDSAGPKASRSTWQATSTFWSGSRDRCCGLILPERTRQEAFTLLTQTTTAS